MTAAEHPRCILMTADTVGGVWPYALELCRQLGPHGIDVVLATMGRRPTAAQRRDLAALHHVTLCESDYALEWMPSSWRDVQRAGDWLLDLERRYEPDLIHLNGYSHARLPWRAPVLVAAHSCVFSWWRAVRGGDPPAEWDQYHEAVSAGLRAAEVVVAPTRAMLGALRHHYGAPAEGIVIHNGRAKAAFTRSAQKESFIFCAGRLWDEAKNVSALAAAASDLPWPARVAGEAVSPEGCALTFSGVELLGFRSEDQMDDLYGAAAIYVLPARYEPFGLSVLEAALAGCALVLGDIPSLRELWNGAAQFVPPDNRALLHATLADLIRSPARRHRLAANARVRAHRYSADRMGARYLETYRRLLTGAAPVQDETLSTA